MQLFTTAESISGASLNARKDGLRISFIPTMGALHEGHLSLVRKAKEASDFVIVSVFVNPTQFGPNEDFASYPRDLKADCRLLQTLGVDCVYAPSAAEIYPSGFVITIDPGPVAEKFEGHVRPGHFAGVLTVVAKLFNQVSPDCAFFGEKDAQQLFLVRRMVIDLGFPVEIVPVPTVREVGGLALSSRNAFLNANERQDACVLYWALRAGSALFKAGERSLHVIQQCMVSTTDSNPSFSPDYATAVTLDEFAEKDPVSETSRLIIAGRLGSVRLIDNMLVS